MERKKNGQIKGMISSSMLILFGTIQQVIPNICTKFQNPRRSSSWEIFDTNFHMYYIGVRNGKMEKDGKNKSQHFGFLSHNIPGLATLKVYKKFEDSGSHRSQEICNRKFDRRERKNGQIKEMVTIRRLILSYTMLQVIPNICTKFQNPRCSCPWEIFDTNFPMYYIGVRDGKKQKWKKKAKINLSILIFFPTIYLATLKVYTKFEDFGSHRSREICDRIFYWRERKMNKGNDKQEEADSLLHNTTSYTQHLYQISNPRFSSSWEIFDEKKSLHTHTHTHKHTHTHNYWKDKNYIPPTYFVCRGYN